MSVARLIVRHPWRSAALAGAVAALGAFAVMIAGLVPPGLSERVPSRADGELFFIVRHGVKFTGMPAWPGRDA